MSAAIFHMRIEAKLRSARNMCLTHSGPGSHLRHVQYPQTVTAARKFRIRPVTAIVIGSPRQGYGSYPQSLQMAMVLILFSGFANASVSIARMTVVILMIVTVVVSKIVRYLRRRRTEGDQPKISKIEGFDTRLFNAKFYNEPFFLVHTSRQHRGHTRKATQQVPADITSRKCKLQPFGDLTQWVQFALAFFDQI